MASQKSKKKPPTKSKKVSKKPAAAPNKKASVKKAANKKAPTKKPAAAKKVVRKKTKAKGKREVVNSAKFEPAGKGARSGGQSGDLQGLSNIESSDSESVEELIEEGNAFEAEVIEGIEDVEDEGEVRTHEVPEDDVPEEYLDKDQ